MAKANLVMEVVILVMVGSFWKDNQFSDRVVNLVIRADILGIPKNICQNILAFFQLFVTV